MILVIRVLLSNLEHLGNRKSIVLRDLASTELVMQIHVGVISIGR